MDEEDNRLDYAHPRTPVEPVEPLVPRRLDSPGMNIAIIGIFVGLMFLFFTIARLGCNGWHV